MSGRQMVGKVVSDKMQKTLVVEVPWVQHHPVYRKLLRRKTRVYVHDPKELGRLGDTVRVSESRPFSHLKRFLLTDIVHRREVVEAPREEAIVAQVTAPGAVGQDEAEASPVIEAVGDVEEEADVEAEASDEPETEEAPTEAEVEPEAEEVAAEAPDEPEAEEAQAEAVPEAEEAPAETDEEAPAEPGEPAAEAGTVEEEDAEAAAPTPEEKEGQI